MKKAIKTLLAFLVKNDLFWKILKPISTIGITLKYLRKSHEKKLTQSKFNHLFDSMTVLNGPFKGLEYPSIKSIGSSIYPKLLGSYERELHQVLSEFFATEYSEIIDIGCAEGYYAVGMALRYKNSKVYAYDIDSEARNLCAKMRELNGVTDNLKIGTEITPKFLESFKFSKKGLIICDCEGCENELFNESNTENLKHCDLIIELHDFINIHTSNNLKKLFGKTHLIQIIYSIDDIHKAQTYDYKEISNMTLEDKKEILKEGRPTIMEWLICKSKIKKG